MKKTFYLTTAIPYVNAKPHIGHALEFVQADVIARYHRLLGEDVCLLSGSDENALKNVHAAEKAGVPIQQFIDANAKLFQELAVKLNVQFDVFQKGSNQRHHQSSQQLWKRCQAAGDIDKRSYEGLYCVGCEAFYTPDELDEKGECPEHPGKKLDNVSEENYFFLLSRYQKQLIDLVESNTLVIIPDFRKNEVLSFLKKPLLDLSISRSNQRAKNWGVPVPGDPSQRMYVWFDALNIYQSGIGFGWDDELYNKWWPADVHVIGKGITRFHAIYWPAFLLSAKLPLPKSLFIHGYFTVNGQKMSKTIGNVIDPIDFLKTYNNPDALRYYLLREIPASGDGDFSERRFKELYNADLANGLGNLVARVAKLCETNTPTVHRMQKKTNRLFSDIQPYLASYRFHEALQRIWTAIAKLDAYMNDKQPWKQSADDAKKTLLAIVAGDASLPSLIEIGEALQPFLPKTAQIILEQFKGPTISSQPPLFPRIT